MISLNKKTGNDFVTNMKKFIKNINNVGKIIQLPKYIDNTNMLNNSPKNEIITDEINEEME